MDEWMGVACSEAVRRLSMLQGCARCQYRRRKQQLANLGITEYRRMIRVGGSEFINSGAFYLRLTIIQANLKALLEKQAIFLLFWVPRETALKASKSKHQTLDPIYP